jgi:hypothetical protein
VFGVFGTGNADGFDGVLILPDENYPGGIGLLVAGDDPLTEGDC